MPDAQNNQSRSRPSELGYRAAVRTAAVAGVFSVVVCAVLLANYHRREAKDPLGTQQLAAMKAELAGQPHDEDLKESIRQLDLQLRRKYFRQREFTEVGAWLLLAGVVVFLVASKSAATLRRKLPMPEPQPPSQDRQASVAEIGRWSVAAAAALVAATAIALSISCQSELPRDKKELAALVKTEPPDSQPGQAGVLAAADYPSDEEIARNWPRFRGPGGLGISRYTNVPVSWDGTSGEGIVWKTPVPLEGNNSPVVWEDRVFLSGATEDARQVYCFDADSGELLWERDVPGTPLSTAEPPEVSGDTGYAAPTTATDGRRVFAIFANGDVAAFDFAGDEVWARSLGIPDNSYGHASSLVTYRGLLLIQFDQGGRKDGLSKLLALNTETGQTVWEVRREVPNSWPSPIVINNRGRPQIITCADPWVIAYDPADGGEIWRAECLSADIGPSPVFADGVVYVANEFPCLSAIRADGEGDVTDTHVLWEGEDGLPDTASPLATDRYVFLLASYGTLTCYAAASGEVLWYEDFDDTFTSSPSLVGSRLYLFGEEGKAWVVEPGAEGCQRISEANLGEPCVTSPAFQDGRIYIRGEEHLFCIGLK